MINFNFNERRSWKAKIRIPLGHHSGLFKRIAKSNRRMSVKKKTQMRVVGRIKLTYLTAILRHFLPPK